MALFNRYETNMDYVTSALNEYDDKYCNPQDYFVTEDECRKYIEDLKKGQKINHEWNHRRRNFWIWLVAGVGLFLTVCLPSIMWLWLESIEFSWSIPVFFASMWIVGGISLYIFNRFEEYMRESTLYKSDYFPPINEKIERIFDDYLWKCEMEKERCKKEQK